MLEDSRAVADVLPVVCHNHPDSTSFIKEASDFDTLVRDGGCSRACTTRLPCGHACSRYCRAQLCPHSDSTTEAAVWHHLAEGVAVST